MLKFLRLDSDTGCVGQTSSNLYVVELKDTFGPRRGPLPHLWVASTVYSPEERYKDLQAGKGRQKHLHGHLGRLRLDLVPSAKPDINEKALKRQLVAKGYTVNGILADVWTTYVLELDLSKVPASKRADRKPRGWVYVGETTKTPEERWEEHRTGKRFRNGNGRLYNTKARDHGLGLHTELMALHCKSLFSKEASKREEKRLATELKAAGYVVEGGH